MITCTLVRQPSIICTLVQVNMLACAAAPVQYAAYILCEDDTSLLAENNAVLLT